MARYTEPVDMSIQNAPPAPIPPALAREARSVVARALGFAFAVLPVPVLGGAMGTLPALTGLSLQAAGLLTLGPLLTVFAAGLLVLHLVSRLAPTRVD